MWKLYLRVGGYTKYYEMYKSSILYYFLISPFILDIFFLLQETVGYPKILYKMRREDVGTNLSNLKSGKMKKKNVIFFTLAFTLPDF